MKAKFISFFFFLLSCIAYSQAPTFSWVSQSNAAEQGNVAVSDSKNDSFGNFIVTGSFYNTVTFGSTTFSATSGRHSYVTKLDDSGNFVWTKSISSTGRIFSYSVDTDPQGNIYVVGNFNGTATFGTTTLVSEDNQGSGSITTSFITKLNAQGDFQWARKIEKLGSLRICVDSENHLLFLSRFSGNINVDNVSVVGYEDFLILKLNSNDGSAIFGKVITDTGDGSFFKPSLITDSANNIYLSCSFTNSAIIGDTTISGDSTANILIAKLNPMGDLIWAKGAGGNADDYGQGLSLDAENNLYASGNYFSNSINFDGNNIQNSGGLEVYLVKLSNSGDFLWAKSYGSTGDDIFQHSVTDIYGNTFLSYGPSYTAYASNSIKIDKNGAPVWNKEIANAGINTLSLDSSQSLFCAGTFKNVINLDGFELQSVGNYDAFFGNLNKFLSVNEINDQSFSIGPIPVNDILSISAKNEQNFSISITDFSGRKILTRNGFKKNAQIDLSELVSGPYILSITTKHKTVNRNFIKK